MNIFISLYRSVIQLGWCAEKHQNMWHCQTVKISFLTLKLLWRENIGNITVQVVINLQNANKHLTCWAVNLFSRFLCLLLALKQHKGTFSNKNIIVNNLPQAWQSERDIPCLSRHFLVYFFLIIHSNKISLQLQDS